jgi:hypothetical protein
MPREDNAQLPQLFLELANARAMGRPLRSMQGGSVIQSIRDKVLAIGVFEQGSVVGFTTDPEPFHFRYDEVERLTQEVVAKYVNGAYRGTSVTCAFKLLDGRVYRVAGHGTPKTPHIVDDFRQIIDPRITAAQVTRMHAALQQGHTVDFGDYVIEPGGLFRPSGFLRKEKRLAWADVEAVVVKSGFVNVRARGRRTAWATTSVVSVPNLSAFTTLVRAATSS